MCDIDLHEPCEVFDERKVKARKGHLCSMCRGPINIGETYVKHFSVFEGEVTSEKMCSYCESDTDEFAAAHEHVRFPPGIMPDIIHECLWERESLPIMLKWARMLKRQAARRDQLLPMKLTPEPAA